VIEGPAGAKKSKKTEWNGQIPARDSQGQTKKWPFFTLQKFFLVPATGAT
jgi:hypothetical protein